MARPITFKPSDIINAANELAKTNKKINGASIRKIIGSGRPDALMSVYNELLKEGKIKAIEESMNVADVVEVRELPKAVEESLNAAVTALKNVVMQCNDIAHNTVEQRLSAAIDKAKAEELFAAEEIQKAEDDLNTAFDEIEQLKDDHQNELDRLNEQITKQDQENTDLKMQLNSINVGLGNLKNTNDDLSTQLKEKTNQCKNAEQNAIVQQTRAEEAAKQLVGAQDANNELTKRLDLANSLQSQEYGRAEKAEAKLAAALEEKYEAKKQMQEQAIITNNALAEVAKSHAEADMSKSQVVALEEREALLHKQLEEQAANMAKDKVKIQTLEQDLKN